MNAVTEMPSPLLFTDNAAKKVKELIDGVYSDKGAKDDLKAANEAAAIEALSEKDLGKRIKNLEKQMLDHARNLEFEKAARVRDQLALLREQAFGAPGMEPRLTSSVKDAVGTAYSASSRVTCASSDSSRCWCACSAVP